MAFRRFLPLIPLALVAAFTVVTPSPSAGADSKPTTTPAWEWGDPTQTPSGVFMPVGDVTSNGHLWHQVFDDDFKINAALGSWANTTCAPKVVYPGWSTYPQGCGWTDTRQHRPYRSDLDMSVHDGELDFWLHSVAGVPAGANISPVLASGSQYQLYGRYSFRARFDAGGASDFYQAFLLWPQNDADGACGETDFPEAHLGLDHVNAFNHTCAGQVQFVVPTVATDWHTWTVQWSPSVILLSRDGVQIGSTPNTFNLARRYQAQMETDTVSPIGDSKHYLIDWFVAYSY